MSILNTKKRGTPARGLLCINLLMSIVWDTAPALSPLYGANLNIKIQEVRTTPIKKLVNKIRTNAGMVNVII